MSDATGSGFPRSLPAAVGLARSWFTGLSRGARVLLLSTAAAAILFGGFVTFQKANEPYAPLFSQLERDDASAIVGKLKELKVPYRIEADGATIAVPESRARELRLELAGSGLPRGGGVGFESFDKMRLGATDFEQRVLYRRALEGELTRTIGTIGAVESARVHLVLPEKSVFITRGEPASASIVLRLRGGRSLGPTEVAGVVHLVASAVPGLTSDRIAVVTTDGATLHRPRKPGSSGSDGDGAEGDEDARVAARSYETSLEDRVRAMLERVVGPGRADVRVTAEIDPARVERVEEHYDPAKSVLRSEEQSTEHGGSEPNLAVAGVPGAESNLPGGLRPAASAAKPAPAASASAGASAAGSASAAPGATPAPALAATPAGATRESHTRNYEIDHVSERRTVGGGALKRLTVAVVLDGVKTDKGVTARPREELDKLALLVKSAAGASEQRGDLVTVESIPFAASGDVLADGPTSPPPAPTKLELAKKWAPFALGAVLLLAVAGVVMRRRGVAAGPGAAAMPQLPAAEPAPSALEAAIRPVLDSGDLRAQALSRATQDPATAALVLRFWLGTAAPEGPDAVSAGKTS
ncbi:MAG: flagellar M-ring protein FliF [Myxococcales bacterium]|nr:flagellar M-ring protein FliF [Myxococcales bacterium]